MTGQPVSRISYTIEQINFVFSFTLLDYFIKIDLFCTIQYEGDTQPKPVIFASFFY